MLREQKGVSVVCLQEVRRTQRRLLVSQSQAKQALLLKFVEASESG